MKKVALLLIFVMMFSMGSPAFAYRTGSATGDAAVYGAGGGVLAGAGAWALCTLGLLCPPVGICAGVGVLGGAVYGAIKSEKTLTSDAIAAGSAVAVPVVVGLGGEKAVKVAEGVLYAGAGGAGLALVNKATEACAEEWKKPEKSAAYADWSY